MRVFDLSLITAALLGWVEAFQLTPSVPVASQRKQIYQAAVRDSSADENDSRESYWRERIIAQGRDKKEYEWFQDIPSLPFDCTGCGKCCRTEGNVYMAPEEYEQAATLLDISERDFIQTYASHTLAPPDYDGGTQAWIRLKEGAGDSDKGCIFLGKDGRTCQIYEARPIQCSTYPFWPEIMASCKDWNEEVCRSDGDVDNGENAPKAGLPYWTPEEGGCEGMQRISPLPLELQQSHNQPANMSEVPLDQVYEKLHWYEHHKRRFPMQSDEVPVVDIVNDEK